MQVWNKDHMLLKAIRQYLFAQGLLVGKTQWEFDQTHILHQVLDCIAVNLPIHRCLDY